MRYTASSDSGAGCASWEDLRGAASRKYGGQLKKVHSDVQKAVKEPALAPTIIRNDDFALAWWKKDDTFWVPKANVIISCKNPIIFASAENAVKARLYMDLVRDEF